MSIQLEPKELEKHSENAIKLLGKDGEKLGDKSKELIKKAIANFVESLNTPPKAK
jgi:hypothetical protein